MTLDLNLLIALDALLQERSVTRAAERLGISQPTMSASLGKLRRHFGDELLDRRGNKYVLSPLAEQLAEQLPDVRSSVERLFDVRLSFDPASSEREFTIVMSDAHLPLLGRSLADLVAREAPGVRLRFVHSTTFFVGQVESALRSVDVLALPQGLVSGMPHLDLYTDEWVCLVSSSGPFGEGLTLDQMQRAEWVLPYMRSSSAFAVLEQLRAAEVASRPAVVVENFLAMPGFIAGSGRIGLGPRRVFTYLDSERVRVVDSPVELGSIVEALWWHPVHDRDPGHRWLRSAVARAAQAGD